MNKRIEASSGAVDGEGFWRSLALVTLVVGTLMVANINGWQVEDDEGDALYSAWRCAEGELPYVDFASTKAPLFVFVGGLFVKVFGRDLLALRLVSAVLVTSSIAALASAISKVYDKNVAILFWIVTLLTPSIYHLARLFRSDSFMIAIVALALASLLEGNRKSSRWMVALSGVLMGLAVLIKILAVMPLVGASAWLCVKAWRRRRWQGGLLDIVLFLGAAFVIGGSGYLAAELALPGAVDFVLKSPGVYSAKMMARLLNGVIGWVLFLKENLVALFGLAMAFMLILHRSVDSRTSFWLLQIAGSAPIFFLSSPAYPRYLVYTIPSLVMVLLGGAVELLDVKFQTMKPANLWLGLLVSLVLAFPSRDLLLRHESVTQQFSDWIALHTVPDAVVVSDYSAINFHAGRRSVFSQAVISHNWAATGLITGRSLVREMEMADVQVVVLHVPGGSRSPQHLYDLVDYQYFWDYLSKHFEVAGTWDRAGQCIVVWVRRG